MLLEAFAKDQLDFIAAERDLETKEAEEVNTQFSKKELEKRGLAVTNLELCGTRTGFGGKTLLDLERTNAVSAHQFSNTFKSGDIIRIAEQKSGSSKLEDNGLEGVVAKVTNERLTVSIERDDFNLSGILWAVKLANSITYDRMSSCIKALQRGEPSKLTNILLGLDSPSSVEEVEVEFFDTSLNESQKSAVRHALGSLEIALIHGPPGTGKTYTLIETIRQLTKSNKKVLVCGPSNISVDNIVERLALTGTPLVRLGHPARLLPIVMDHSLDILTRTSESGALVKDIRAELDRNLTRMSKIKGKAKRELYLENKILRKEFRERERRSIKDILDSSQVVLCTLHGSGSKLLQNRKFDVVIIDEVSQALEASCWIPLLYTTRLILAGDHQQLSPMIKSSPSKESSTRPQMSMFERLLTLHGERIKAFLSVQYRMNEAICAFPSKEMYHSLLTSAESVKTRVLSELPHILNDENTSESLVFIDTQGGEYAEDQGGESKSNARECELVVEYINALLEAGVTPSEIAIVTPYSAQVSLLSSSLRNITGLEIGTVDGFQGREKEVIVLSLVRSNELHEIGFLADERRLNVAMTRARRQLCVIGDSETIGRKGFMKRWMEFLTESADLRYPN